MKKRSRKSFTVDTFAIRVIKDHAGRIKLQIIRWAHSGKDSLPKKLIRLIDGAPAPYLDEKQYRWCANDAETPTPLAGENTAISGVVNCDVLRLRVNIANTGTADAKNIYLGLQYSDDGGVTWYSLGGAPDAPANPHFEYQLSDFGIDKTLVTTLILTASDTAGLHIESVPSASITIEAGTTVEFDFCIHCTAYASSYTTYLFKIVKTDETGAYLADLDAYTTQPELTTGEIVVVVEKYASDSATGIDTPIVSAEISVSDPGTGTDVAIVSYAEKIATDTGTGMDVATVEGKIPVEDLGSGEEVVSIEGAIPVIDDGLGSDVVILSYAEKKVEDVGTGTDVVEVGKPTIYDEIQDQRLAKIEQDVEEIKELVKPRAHVTV